MSVTLGLELVLGLGDAGGAAAAFEPDRPRPASRATTTRSTTITAPPISSVVACSRDTARVPEPGAIAFRVREAAVSRLSAHQPVRLLRLTVALTIGERTTYA